MGKRLLTLSLLITALITLTFPAVVGAGDPLDLEGKYTIQGWSPGTKTTGEPEYQGTAILSRWGDTFRYHGFMDDMTYAGAAIHDAERGTLSLSFINGDGSERGVSYFQVKEDGKLEGVWAMDNGGNGKLGFEIWTKQ